MRVLYLPDFRHGNPYQQRLADCLRERGVAVQFSSGDARRLLARQGWSGRRFDIAHVHWPENYVTSRSRAKLILRSALFLLLLRTVQLRGSKVVWTIHNLHFHESWHPVVEESFRRRLALLCDGIAVHFPEAVEIVRRRWRVELATPVVVTPLGGDPPNAPRGSREAAGGSYHFCLIGEIRRYKNVPLVLDAFHRLEDPRLRLLIAGRVRDPSLERSLRDAAARDPRVTLRLGFLSETDLEECLASSDALILGGDQYFTSASALQAAQWGLAVVAPYHQHLASFLALHGWARYQANAVDDLGRAMTEAAEGAVAGTANRASSLEFTYDRQAATTAELYRRVLS